MPENIIDLAVEKLDRELKEFHGDRYGQAVKTEVANTLRYFCKQDERFANIVYKTKRTLSDCVKDVMHGCGNHISDIDVYRKAGKFYFPNSEIDMIMTITYTGEDPDDEYLNKEPEKEPEKKQAKASSKEKDKESKELKTQKKESKKEVIQLSLFDEVN